MDSQATSVTISLLQYVKDAGLVGMLFLILYGSYKEIWVWGRLYREMKADRDQWKHQALKNTNLAERAVDLATTTK